MLLCSGWPVYLPQLTPGTWCELQLQPLPVMQSHHPCPPFSTKHRRRDSTMDSTKSDHYSCLVEVAPYHQHERNQWMQGGWCTGVIVPYVTIGSPGRSGQHSSIGVYIRGGDWMPRLKGWGWLIHITRRLMTLAEGRWGRGWWPSQSASCIESRGAETPIPCHQMLGLVDTKASSANEGGWFDSRLVGSVEYY